MATEITSTKNIRIRDIRALNDKKSRDESGLFIAEGEKLVREACVFVPEAITAVVMTDEYADEFSRIDCEQIIAPDHVIAYISEQKTPQGVLAVIDSAKLPDTQSDRILIMDGVADPTNVGAMIRSADAFNFRRAVLSGCADVYSPKSVRASMGSVFRVCCRKSEDLASEYEKLRKAGYAICATALDGVCKPRELEKCAVVIGNESRGISEVSKSNADMLVKIDMPGQAESLNAAVAAGIMMYIMTNQGVR